MGDIESWGEAGEKYKIHQETLQFYKLMTEEGARPIPEQTVEEARRSTLERSQRFAGNIDFNGTVKEYTCPSPHSSGGIPLSVYIPSDFKSSSSILVYFHGGGLVIGSRQTVDNLCKLLARDAECAVINVEYRLAPEHKVPACFQDAKTVVRWVVQNKGLFGGLNTSKIGVMGDSGGGQIAASVCYDIKGIAFQVLVYPMTDMTCSLPSFKEFALIPGLNESTINWFMERALKSAEQRKDPNYNPGIQISQCNLPPALIILAQLDPLRDCGYAYRHKLTESGVKATTVLIRGAPHAFYHLPGFFKELCGEANKHVTQFIKPFNC